MTLARIASRISTALFGVAMLALLVLALGPHTGAYRTVTVLSDSMQPTFSKGDMIVVTPAPTRSVQVGDVITYQAPVGDRHVVTHRVQEVVEAGPQPTVVTKGDANESADPWRAQLTGERIWKVQFAVPAAGTLVRALRQDGVRHVAAYVLPALLLVIVLREVWSPRSPKPEDDADIAADVPGGEDWWDLVEVAPYDEDLPLPRHEDAIAA